MSALPSAAFSPRMSYRVVVCDDEGYIANATAMLLQMQPDWDMNIQIFTASQDALLFSREHRVDLLITDIRMPKLSGLELMHAVMDQWPGCQAVMLTAHSEFDYVYDAIQRDQVSYVLKCDGHDALLSAVRKRMDALENSFRQARMTEAAQRQARNALPYLRREWLMDLLRGTICPPEQWERAEKALALPLSLKKPFSAVLMLVQVYGAQDTFLEQSQRMELVTGLFQGCLPGETRLLSVPMDRRRILCLVQGKDDRAITAPQLEGVLEQLQQSALLQLNLPFSIVYDPVIADSSQLAASYERMRFLHSERAMGREEIWLLRAEKTTAASPSLLDQQAVTQTKTWRHAFENGDPLADDLLEGLLARLARSGLGWDIASMELYLQLALNIAGILRGGDVWSSANNMPSLSTLLRVDAHGDPLAAAGFLRRTVEGIRAERARVSSNALNETVVRIQAYVQTHLDEDFNIAQLADEVGLNASYISRLFRKATGDTLIAYVTRTRVQHASALLEDPSLQIQQISRQMGFWNPAYFSFFFKKNTGMTPSEYRERHAAQ